jgi:hypothetical protein
MKKQTAIEFLVDEFKEKLIGNNVPEWVEKIIQQSLAMEKEQIIRTHLMARCYDNKNSVTEAEEYYKETFKSE